MRALCLVIVVAAASAAAISSCTVDRKSTGLACTTQSDCTGNRLCEGGYCVVDYAMCPKQCTTCDVTKSPPVCTINGSGDSVTCPSGMHCDIGCAEGNACGSINCTNAASCKIDCSTRNACDNITCGAGACDVTCSGTMACGSVTCTNSCACDVVCSANDCGTLSCPKVGSAFCTSSGNNNQPCMSAISGCSHC